MERKIEITDYCKDYGFGRYAVRIDGETKGTDYVSDVLEMVLHALIGKEKTSEG